MNANYCKNKLSKNLRQAIEFLRIISEKHRLKILFLLKEKERCVYDIWQALCLSQNLVSHHLKFLKDFGLISARKEGVKIFYKLDQTSIEKNLVLLNKFFKFKME